MHHPPPPLPDPAALSPQDEQSLKLLVIFHYVLGGIVALFSLMPVLYIVIGAIIWINPEGFESEGDPPPAFLGLMFIAIGTIFMTLGMLLAGAVAIAGRFLAKRRRHTFCLIIAGLTCIFMPLGTMLGAFTIIVLMREPVRQAFDAPAVSAPAA